MTDHAAVVSPALPKLRSHLLDELGWLRYGITRRIPGMGIADGNVSYSGGRDRDDAWDNRRRWATQFGMDAGQIVTSGQIHGTALLPVRAADAGKGARPDSSVLGVGDGMMTNEPGPVLLSLHADCLPMILADRRLQVVAVVHAGWRGTVADMAGAAIRAITTTYGSHTHDVVAFLGPSISGARYEVGPEVAAAWSAIASPDSGAIWPGRDDRSQCDLGQANRERLMASGVPAHQIEDCGICTATDSSEWFSHRALGATTGRFGVMVTIVSDADAVSSSARA